MVDYLGSFLLILKLNRKLRKINNAHCIFAHVPISYFYSPLSNNSSNSDGVL